MPHCTKLYVAAKEPETAFLLPKTVGDPKLAIEYSNAAIHDLDVAHDKLHMDMDDLHCDLPVAQLWLQCNL